MMTGRLLIIGLIVTGCGSINYAPPTERSARENTVLIPAPREAFWKIFVSNLSSDFFVINNLDKETGLINVSYSGDPERFVDCGRIISKVSNAAGERTYDFPAARANQSYEVMNGIHLLRVNRQMQLDGRMNIIVQEEEKTSTRVTVSTRYALNRRVVVSDTQGRSASNADSASFNYGQDGYFPIVGNSPSVTCRSTGNLERQIILTAQKSAAAHLQKP